MVRRENKNNAYAKFGGTNKVLWYYFLHLNLILKLMVAGLLLLPHLLFGMHFHSNLDLVIPFLLLNLSSRLGFLKLVMMLYRMMMFL